MHYLIDGYNLLFRTIYKDVSKGLAAQREQVILDLNEKASALEIDVTVIFDSAYRFGEFTRSHFKHLEIIYSGEGQSADDYILDAIKDCPKPFLETVVTSDKKLAEQVRRRSAKTESVEKFLEWVCRRYKNKRKPQKVKEKLAIPLPPKKTEKQIPPSQYSSDQCFDYYQRIFELEYEKLASQTKNITPPASKLKRKQKQKQKQNQNQETTDGLSEMDRWLKLFEKKPENR